MPDMLEHVIVPPQHPPTQGKALHAVVLHGLGDSMQGWMPVADELDIPSLGYVFVNAPDQYAIGWSWFDLFDGEGGTVPVEQTIAGVRRSRAKLQALLAHLGSSAGLHPSDLVLLGFSQGCLMALDVGLRSAQPLAGIVGISGWLGGAEEYPAAFGAAAKQQPVLWTHGLYDELIPISDVRPQAALLRSLGVDVTWKEYAKGHTLDTQRELHDLRSWLAGRITAHAATEVA